MAEASNIRLVRCPKCGNLLPELPDYSLYKCGGCGAVLRAKKKVPTNGVVLENYGKENNIEGGLCRLSERENDDTEFSSNEDRVRVEENVDLVRISSSLRRENESLFSNDDAIVGQKYEGLGLGRRNFEREIRSVGSCRRQLLKHPIDVLVCKDDEDTNLNRSSSVNSSVANGIGEVNAKLKNSANVMRSRVITDKWVSEREGVWGFDEGPRAVAEHGRFSPFTYSDEGSSNHKPSSFYGHGKPMKEFVYSDEPNGVESLEQNRAEFRRKLNDLLEQIRRLEEKPRERILGDRKTSPSESYRHPRAYNVSRRPFLGDNHVAKPPNFNHCLGPAPSKNDRNLDPRCVPVPHQIPRSTHAGPFRSQMLRRPHNQPPPQYPNQPPPHYFSGQYVDFSQDLLASHPRQPFFHRPACSSLHCSNKHWQVPSEVSRASFSNKKFAEDPMRPNFYHRGSTVEFGPKKHVPLGAIPPLLQSQDPQVHTGWSADIDSDVDAFYQSRPRRVMVAHGNRRLCHPIAGGAPFMICCNCLELLKLPMKIVAIANNLQKLQCGTCSTSYSFEIKNKRLIISVPKETEHISAETNDISHDPLHGGLASSYGTAGGTNSYSNDLDFGYNFHSADTKQNLLFENRIYLSGNERRQGCRSSSYIFKADEQRPDGVIVRDISNCAKPPSKDDMPPTVGGVPFSNHEISSSEMGSKSKWVDQEKVALQQKAEKDETEVKVSFNDYPDISLSHHSVEISKKDQPRICKGHKTFWVGLIKRSFKDFPKSTESTENARPGVLVNGQQIPDHLLKKAEKLAGPIEPGDYWYDFRAGFWGVMGQPCLGIILVRSNHSWLIYLFVQ
ncbi:hypothetical protein CISIN_1g002433mg [Citrus sinensis]|uniref:Uncharacterized protein n=1 Tax=Citrus sinensis TaxID=2711 RepID=A0A067GMB7_CITSI|nr:hypothetical protein CISIN_1g002433mg [Citrus sinensis]